MRHDPIRAALLLLTLCMFGAGAVLAQRAPADPLLLDLQSVSGLICSIAIH